MKEIHKEAVRRAETEGIRKAMDLAGWNRRKAAPLLGVSYKSLLNKIRDLGITNKI